ncbi:hypothetical protein PUNSTDRAFT_94829 [Punctularia strigosozonata HHB-11173 SS5]|uniref:uncharacterized protein n=1 Tax=Punctularia strigosozonata (strain HHB-11173) TaxID=741275 RepID=UPI000441711C|nr:uncharacterized protein PUNSTDRAFT_94829 [Punctularia strigosozonata HHB-11173 SS5]EIN13635.1 hypothetical protein PUNSTDRAFT_94829 [Punctularia strigosozonata HHB-11173 SS5]
MDQPLLSIFTSLSAVDPPSAFPYNKGGHTDTMDGDGDMSVLDSPAVELDPTAPEQSEMDKQKIILQSYVDSLPYECEPIEEMHAKLEEIVSKIVICAKSRNWLVLTTWDGMLQCWLLMRYPIPKTTRAKMVRLYYELCLLPGIEPRAIRSWADMFSRLLSSNKDSSKRKLDPADLELPWRPLWDAMQKEIWPKRKMQDSTRNVVNILLYVAEHSRRYYPASEIPAMLDTFLPLLTQDTVLTIVPVITSFLPPTHTSTYLPVLFRLWEAFNSSVIDERMLELVGDLSEEHVAGVTTASGGTREGGAEWKDVGIWSETDWTMLVGKSLGSMNVPVGATRGASTTAGHADSMGDRQSLRIKKAINRYHALAKLFVYSMAVDGPIRDAPGTPGPGQFNASSQSGYLAGSKALDSLDRLITSTESFFHPSNSGPWTLALTTFIQRLTSEFSKRWHEEAQASCETPITHRLTLSIRRAFVKILRTPALLAMFSKDPISMSYAQGALKYMAVLEPSLVMPELLERAYGGLEVVNETHRTTAVLSMLSGVALPLVNEHVWLGGQKHIVPLLELCIPGIDLNDPIKTVCTTMFIVSAVQHIKIGDLSIQQSGLALSSDAPAEDMMDVDSTEKLPEASENTAVFSRAEERALVRDSTAAFADWVTMLFRRVFALYENLPEEGGRRNTTGGKQEESVLKAIKSTLDVVCLHLSDQMFDLVLKVVYDYATNNAKANSVRAFGQLVACLSRVHPTKTIDKFLPYCVAQIKDELKHGASSVRTTSTNVALPSDTTLHWNLSLLRGCLGYGGVSLLKHKAAILEVMRLLVEKTKNERGYSSTGRLITRVLHTLAGVYPLNSRFVNTDEWDDPVFNKDHNTQWGKLYTPQDVKIEWHVPQTEEIEFILEILDNIAAPALDNVVALLGTATWDSDARNEFCRYLQACKAIWGGLPTLCKDLPKTVVNPCINEDTELDELLVSFLDVKAGFTLTDPSDPRYQKAAGHRRRFGEIVHKAAIFLQQKHEGEDHIDAVIAVAKAIDVYLLEYGMTRGTYDSLQKNYGQARDLNRAWPRQKENSRLVFIKRAQVYHSGRVYMHALYRRRSELDDHLLLDLTELSLSPYTRVRRQAQAIWHNVCGYFVRSTRFALPALLDALAKGTDPDRMKGALYVLWNKGTATYTLADENFRGQYLKAILESQHQEKPSIQKLISSIASDVTPYLSEEAVHTDAFMEDISAVEAAIESLRSEFSPALINQGLLEEALAKAPVRSQRRIRNYDEVLFAVLDIASRPTTHWRYVQMATRILIYIIRRDAVPAAQLAAFFASNSISPHPTIRSYAQRGLTKLAWFIKIRSYAKSTKELWLDTWRNPLSVRLPVPPGLNLLQELEKPIYLDGREEFYVDKLPTGFLTWTTDVKAYKTVTGSGSAITWESLSQPALQRIREQVLSPGYWAKLAELWSQESNRTGTIELRSDHVTFVKSLAKMVEDELLQAALPVIEPLLTDSDRFKQRAGAEVLTGLIRGSKHWTKSRRERLWGWTSSRLGGIFSQIKPDTLSCWEGVFSFILEDRDPRRNKPLLEWLLSLSLDFQGDSAFQMSKTLSLFGILVDCLGIRFLPMAGKYVDILFANTDTGYAEMRAHISQNLYIIGTYLWRPSYPSTRALLDACSATPDPLKFREAKFMPHLSHIMQQLPKWREERLPPPRVNQSQYDKVGLTLLQWLWVSSHGPQAPLVFPYSIALLPEILRMSELNDSSELQLYSAAVLYVLSAVTPPPEYTGIIMEHFVNAIKSSEAWRIRLNALPTLVVFLFRNLLGIPDDQLTSVTDALLDCLADENVEVREMASKAVSGVVRCSQRHRIVPLKNRFVLLAQSARLPRRQDPTYAGKLRSLHSAILGLCALIESFPYSVEPWMPPLTDVLAAHATDPPPISTTIRKCASEFKKTHQDTWHKDQQAFNEEQLQNLSTMLVGTSYYA